MELYLNISLGSSHTKDYLIGSSLALTLNICHNYFDWPSNFVGQNIVEFQKEKQSVRRKKINELCMQGVNESKQ